MNIYNITAKKEEKAQVLAGLKATLCSLDSTIERAMAFNSNQMLNKYIAQLESVQRNIEKEIAYIQKRPFTQFLSFE